MFSPTSATPEIWAPLHLEYGVNTTFGDGCFMNFNYVILDIAAITIGANTLFGPACQLITVEHPVNDAQQRAEGWERGRPITIGDNCVIAAGAVITKTSPQTPWPRAFPRATPSPPTRPASARSPYELRSPRASA